ncbi:hypothetical protein [Neorhizobium sp. JUb45]|uniref:hypothetical protein n=1 Tax=Neorhizobium sp. JUb45 TaxID=2485113 RepID=UPI0010464912|nr:hypothetical protein [Neorhizobium sp. JUb45]TCR01096.1 hypothetical protein EDF70_105101 [Neorhizobium sp. JUb45]
MRSNVSYGCTRSFGSSTYSVSGYSSEEAAEFAVMSMAQDAGDWHPPTLRTARWQFWRPTEYSDLEKRLIARASP